MFNIEQLFQLFNQPQNKSKQTRIIISHDFLVSTSQFTSFSDEVKNLYEQIFVLPTDTEQNRNKQIMLETKLMFQPKQTPMPVCNKILNRNQPVFRCYDCMTHQASVLCKKCFQNGNHKGHRYSQISSGGGNCDCGNPDAIKPDGFCINHPGKAQPVILDEKEEAHFMQVIGIILQWIFRLHQKEKSKSSDILGQQLAEFLLKINDKSLYYNTLTCGLMFRERQYAIKAEEKKKKYIEKIFEYGVKLINFARKMTDVFLNMFSLEVFKYQITVSYTQAYNNVRGFETSKFKSLYIQLFANNDILDKMLDEQKMVLYPQKESYEFDEYIENLVFLSTIKQEVARKFFVLLNQKGYIRFSSLDMIQQNVENNGQHIVSIINETLNQENHYYLLMYTVVGLVQKQPQSLIKMLQNYVDAAMETKYSYRKNKVIEPFHKILGMILLAIYKGDLQKFNAQQIQKFIDFKYSAKQIFTKVFKLILHCWKEFARTFFQTSYFDNYIPLYVKSGHTTVIFDLFMFTVCVQIFGQISCGTDMNSILINVFQLKLQNEEQKHEQKEQRSYPLAQKDQIHLSESMQMESQDDWMYQQLREQNQNNQQQKKHSIKTLKKNIQLMRLMIEACISQRAQIVISNSIHIKEEKLKVRTEQLFVQVMNNFKEITVDNLKLLIKNFIQTKNLQQDFIKNFLTFDKTKKKYSLNQLNDQKFSNIKAPLFLYPTIKKIGGIFAKQVKEPLENLLLNVKLQQSKIRSLRFLFNENFLNLVCKQFIDELKYYFGVSYSQEKKQMIKIFMDFVDVIKTLQYLMREQVPKAISNLYYIISELSLRQEFSFLGQKHSQKQSQDLIKQQKLSRKMKFEEKKKKKLQRFKQIQQFFTPLLDEKTEEKDQNQSLCMICKEDNSEGLCFLSSFNYSNILQAFNKVGGRSLVFDSCFHAIHINCFMKTSKHQSLPCPLCKSLSNIMLPLQKQFFNTKTILDVYQRIITLKATFQDHYEGFDKEFQEQGILSIFKALCSMIGKNLLKNEPIFDQKDQRLANILFEIAKTVAEKGLKQHQKISEAKALNRFLETLKKKNSEHKSEATHFYAVQYVILKILQYSFTQKLHHCTSVLQQDLAKCINKNDLRKIWQMCQQIVSLPCFEETQKVTTIKQMYTIIDIFRPPKSVFELIKVRDSPQMSCKNGHQISICLICKIKCCYDCKEIMKHFREVHCEEGLAFNLVTGGLIYVCEGQLVQIPSLYCSQMGFEWKPSKSAQGFGLDNQTYQQIKLSILNYKVKKFLTQRYPNNFKNLGMNLNGF